MSSLLLPALHVGPSPAQPGDDVSSSESSSIGSASSDAESEIKDDATSSLGSLSSLQDSLPIKKGLSNHFVGKSRSFSNLSECEDRNAVDLAKGENPFNKRRRIQIASRISYQRRASCSSLISVPLPPLLSPEHALQEAEEENDCDSDNDNDNDGDGGRTGKNFPSLAPTPHGGNLFNGKIMIANEGEAKIKAPRSFPLFHL